MSSLPRTSRCWSMGPNGNSLTGWKNRHPVPDEHQKGNLIIPRHRGEVLFATLESESRVRGPNFNWGWTDELDYLSDQKCGRRSWARSALVTIRNCSHVYPEGQAPDLPRMGAKRDRPPPPVSCDTYDNPFIDADDYVSGLGYEGRFADQEISAEFVSFDGLVYDGFDRTRNVARWIPLAGERIAALTLALATRPWC